MEYVIWPVVVLCLIVLMEYKRERLRKPWYHWATIVFFLVAPWLVLAALDKYADLRLHVLSNLLLPAFYLLGAYIFDSRILGYANKECHGSFRKIASRINKYPRLVSGAKMLGSGVLAASFSIMIGISIVSQAGKLNLGGVFAEERKHYSSILAYGAIWALTTLVVVLFGAFFSTRKFSFGIIAGLCTACFLTYIQSESPVLTRILVVLGPIIAGCLGGKLSGFIPSLKKKM